MTIYNVNGGIKADATTKHRLLSHLQVYFGDAARGSVALQDDVGSTYCEEHAIPHASLLFVKYPSASEVEHESDFEPADFSEESYCTDTDDEDTGVPLTYFQ